MIFYVARVVVVFDPRSTATTTSTSALFLLLLSGKFIYLPKLRDKYCAAHTNKWCKILRRFMFGLVNVRSPLFFHHHHDI
jgi:hypothetical protein